MEGRGEVFGFKTAASVHTKEAFKENNVEVGPGSSQAMSTKPKKDLKR